MVQQETAACMNPACTFYCKTSYYIVGPLVGPLQTRYKTAYKSHLHRSLQDNNKNLAGSLNCCPILSGRERTWPCTRQLSCIHRTFTRHSYKLCTRIRLSSAFTHPLRNCVGSKVACILYVKCVVCDFVLDVLCA